MKKRVTGRALQEKKDFKIASVSLGLGGMGISVTIKGLCNKEFPVGGMYGLRDPDLIKEGRHNVEFIELFPYRDAPKLYNEELLEQYHVIELCEKFGVSHPVTNGIKIILSKEHVFVFVKVSNGEPSKEFLQAIKAFCDDKGIEWLPAEQIEAKYPDLFEG